MWTASVSSKHEQQISADADIPSQNSYSLDRNSFLCENWKAKEANPNWFQLMDVVQIHHKWKKASVPSVISAHCFKRIYTRLCKWVLNKWSIQTFAKILIFNFRSWQISVKHDFFSLTSNRYHCSHRIDVWKAEDV